MRKHNIFHPALLITLLAATTLGAACSEKSAPMYFGTERAQDSAKYAPAPIAEYDMAPSSTSARSQTAPQQHEAENYLAYSYNYGFALPADTIAPSLSAHTQICTQAGPSKCQLLSSNINTQYESSISAQLKIRAEPVWLETYIPSLQSSVTDAQGRMTNSSVSAQSTSQIRLLTQMPASMPEKRSMVASTSFCRPKTQS